MFDNVYKTVVIFYSESGHLVHLKNSLFNNKLYSKQ